MGWKCHNNICPGVIFLVSVPTAIRKCRGVWQQWNKKLINLSPTALNGGTVRPKLWQDYMEKLRYNICSMSYIHFIRTVMEIELSKKIYISLELRKSLAFIQIIWNKIHVCIHLQYEQWIKLFFFLLNVPPPLCHGNGQFLHSWSDQPGYWFDLVIEMVSELDNLMFFILWMKIILT